MRATPAAASPSPMFSSTAKMGRKAASSANQPSSQAWGEMGALGPDDAADGKAPKRARRKPWLSGGRGDQLTPRTMDSQLAEGDGKQSRRRGADEAPRTSTKNNTSKNKSGSNSNNLISRATTGVLTRSKRLQASQGLSSQTQVSRPFGVGNLENYSSSDESSPLASAPAFNSSASPEPAPPPKSDDALAKKIYQTLHADGVSPPPWPSHAGDPQNKQVMARFREQYEAYRSRVRSSLTRAGLIDDPEERKSLREAIEFKGICEDMCPEFEKITRITEMDIHQPEKSRSSGFVQPDRMIKKLARSAAGQEAPLPMDVRSAPALRRTLDYLVDDLLRHDQNLPFLHSFLWDRTRAIRRDFSFFSTLTESELRSQVYVLENISRFHVISLHLLSRDQQTGDGGFVEQQELEQLGKALLSLRDVYDDCNEQGIKCANEAEFRAYYLLFHARDPSILEILQRQWKAHLWQQSDEVRTAVSLVEALQNTSDFHGPLKDGPSLAASGAHQSYFRIVEDAKVSYMMACFAECHFPQLRRSILQTVKRALARPKAQAKDVTATVLNKFLLFDTVQEAIRFAELHNLGFAPDEAASSDPDHQYLVLNDRSPLPHRRLKHQFSQRLVESKRGARSLPDLIHGTGPGELDGGAPPVSSFNNEQESLFVQDDDGPPEGEEIADAGMGGVASTTSAAFGAKPASSSVPSSSSLLGNNAFIQHIERKRGNPETESVTLSEQPAMPRTNPFATTATTAAGPPAPSLFAPATKPGPILGLGSETMASGIARANPFASPPQLGGETGGSSDASGSRKTASNPFASAPISSNLDSTSSDAPPKALAPEKPLSASPSSVPATTHSSLGLGGPTFGFPPAKAGPAPSPFASASPIFGTSAGAAATTSGSSTPASTPPKPNPFASVSASGPDAPRNSNLPPRPNAPLFQSPFGAGSGTEVPATALGTTETSSASAPSSSSLQMGGHGSPGPSSSPKTDISDTRTATGFGIGDKQDTALQAAATGSPSSTPKPSGGKATEPIASSPAKTFTPQGSKPDKQVAPLTVSTSSKASGQKVARRDVMGDFTKWFVQGDEGIMADFTAEVVSWITTDVFEEFQQQAAEERQRAEDERTEAEVERFRVYNLSLKFFYRWKRNARSKRLRQLRQRGRDKMRQFYESQRQSMTGPAPRPDGPTELARMVKRKRGQDRDASEALLSTGVLSGVEDAQEAAERIVGLAAAAAASSSSSKRPSSGPPNKAPEPAKKKEGAKTRALRQRYLGPAPGFRRSLPASLSSRDLETAPSERRASNASPRWILKSMGIAALPDGTAVPDVLLNKSPMPPPPPVESRTPRQKRKRPAKEAEDEDAMPSGSNGRDATAASKRKRWLAHADAPTEPVAEAADDGSHQRLLRDADKLRRELRAIRAELEEGTAWFKAQNERLGAPSVTRSCDDDDDGS